MGFHPIEKLLLEKGANINALDGNVLISDIGKPQYSILVRIKN